MQELRGYQGHALDALRKGIAKGDKAQVLQMATGSGKTTIASHMMAGAKAKGKRAFFVVDSLELVDQAYERFRLDGMDVGIIQGDHMLTDYACPIQVCTIQTLKNRWNRMSDRYRPDLVVIDEAHVLHAAHKQVIEWCKEQGVPVIGLSATPFRKALGQTYDSLTVGATTKFLTDKGYLTPAIYYAPYTPDLKGVKTKADGDWQEDSLAEAMSDDALVGDIVETWLKHGENRQTLVFAANVAHSRLLMDKFKQVGVNADHVDGYDRDKAERQRKIHAFRNRDIKVLCNCAVLTKGFDAPETSCIVLARPTKSLMLHIQMLGRGLRIAPGKENCKILDHAGNIRNGLPTDPLPEELHDREQKENPDRKKKDPKEPLPQACQSCGFVSTKHKCPQCGFEPKKRDDVEVIEGELYPVDEDRPKEMRPAELQAFYSQLLHYAMQKGYKPGWAWHKTREYAGRAPKNTKSIPPRPPTENTLQIIRHLNIKASKRAEKEKRKVA